MTETEIMLAVANHPKVQAYRKAVQIMHNRMVALYGQDYACARRESSTRKNESLEGFTRMTPLDEARFNSLMRGAAIVRQDARNSLVGTA